MEGILDGSPKGSSSGSSPLDINAISFPQKPVARGLTNPIKVVSNFYPLVCTQQKAVIFAYQVKTTPQLTCHTNKERETLKRLINAKENRAELESIFDSFIYWEQFLYSFEKVDDSNLPTHTKTQDDIEYNISYEYHSEHTFESTGAQFFFRAFMNKLI